MTSRRAAIALAALLSLVPAAGRAATVWTTVASEKIRPDARPRGDASASIGAAKNEFEAFQIVVTGPASGVSAFATELKGAGTIDAPRLYREDLIDVKQPSSADGATGRFPDALVPDVDEIAGEKRNAFPFDVAAGESRAIWVEVHVPAGAKPGDYTGSVSVRTKDGETNVPVHLTVWDFALPSTSSLKTAFGMNYGGVRAGHGAPSGDALAALRERYGRFALDHRISIHNVWDDSQQKDWNHFDQTWGPLLDGTAKTQLEGARLTSMSAGVNVSSVADHQNWATHFKGKGWFDRLFQYTCDEPPLTCQWSDVANRARVAKQADPNFRTLVTTDMEQAQKNSDGGKSVDVMVPLVNYMDDRPANAYGKGRSGDTRGDYDAFLASGKQKELWLYESCMSHGCGGTVDIGNPSADQMYYTGWPSYVIDASATRARALEWFSFRYGASGELYYETTVAYDHDAWSNQWDFSGNGDGTLFYPGTPSRIGGHTDVPVASIRLKMIREGLEDFEYLKLLADVGGAEDAKAIAAKLFPHPWQSDVKAADLMAAREEIARKILARTGKSVPEAGLTVPGGLGSGGGAFGADVAGGGCSSGGGAVGLLNVLLLPLALVAQRLRARRRK
ncbi:MAG TPA: glycoside hydrolase domain-containing protein [Anaeromyxobacteraceae bacterium]|nr:glycoside hydrolase domain-containing protein [Anaeromyxobacteraceae bacterium]